ncbi:MAG: efflux RND transporter periplasmic adaptor subunit [Flavobacteriaceae bacterium]|nr:efflux RND transporter periplasmic adaptor subunit [Flavobacteriaceae bacterium]
MKKTSNIILILIIMAIIGFILLKNIKSFNSTSEIKTEHAFLTNIELKRVIAGNLFPLTEIAIKSPISGILDKTFVKIGDKIEIGNKIVQIKLVPDPSKLEYAKSNLNSAKIRFNNQQKIFNRNKKLFKKEVIAKAEFEEYQKAFYLSKEQYLSAKNQLTLIQKGFVENSDISNIVKSTASGTIIDLPLNKGSSVIERNNFDNGTTLAVVARLDTFVFRGMVNETDMIHLRQGMKLSLNINAYKNQVKEAILYKISSKGKNEQGVMKYNIEARFKLSGDSLVIRSGYSANAEIILQKKENILAIKEKYLQFQNDSAYVTILGNDDKEEKCFLKTGLSDGINIEIMEGLDKNSKFIINDK